MVEVARGDLDVTDPQLALDELVVANRGAELLELDGKVGVLHLARERVAQRLAEPARRIDVPLVARHEERHEEGNALDVIPVRMADQDMDEQGPAARHQLAPKNGGAGAHVEDNERA